MNSTPETTRRRQTVEAVVLIIIGLVMVGQQFYNQNVNAKQDAASDARAQAQADCFAGQFEALSKALNARSDIATKSTKSQVDYLLGLTDPNITYITTEERKRYFETVQRARSHFIAEQDAIAADREANPYPSYPNGKCEK